MYPNNAFAPGFGGPPQTMQQNLHLFDQYYRMLADFLNNSRGAVPQQIIDAVFAQLDIRTNNPTNISNANQFVEQIIQHARQSGYDPRSGGVPPDVLWVAIQNAGRMFINNIANSLQRQTQMMPQRGFGYGFPQPNQNQYGGVSMGMGGYGQAAPQESLFNLPGPNMSTPQAQLTSPTIDPPPTVTQNTGAPTPMSPVMLNMDFDTVDIDVDENNTLQAQTHFHIKKQIEGHVTVGSDLFDLHLYVIGLTDEPVLNEAHLEELAIQRLPYEYFEGEFSLLVYADELVNIPIGLAEYETIVMSLTKNIEESAEVVPVWSSFLDVLDERSQGCARRIDQFLTPIINTQLKHYFRYSGSLKDCLQIGSINDLKDLSAGKWTGDAKKIQDWRAILDNLIDGVINTYFYDSHYFKRDNPQLFANILRSNTISPIVNGLTKFDFVSSDPDKIETLFDHVCADWTLITKTTSIMMTNALNRHDTQNSVIDSAHIRSNTQQIFWRIFSQFADQDYLMLLKGVHFYENEQPSNDVVPLQYMLILPMKTDQGALYPCLIDP